MIKTKLHNNTITLVQGDCLEILPLVKAGIGAMVFADLPYGTTGNKWDTVIPLAPLWDALYHATVSTAPLVFTASQPFTTTLAASNLPLMRYAWVWNKMLAGNGILAKKQPLKIHEDVLVFSREPHRYAPIMRTGKARNKGGIKDSHGTFSGAEAPVVFNDQYYPTSIVEFSGAAMRSTRIHPTQKPVELVEYLIKTYTLPGDLVIDPTMGVGTTAVACVNTGRRCLGIELRPDYYELAVDRISKVSPC